MLTRCVHCRFFVRETDDYCFNCGVESPTSKPSGNGVWRKLYIKLMRSGVFLLVLSFLTTTLLGMFLMVVYFSKLPVLPGWFWFAAYATWFAIFIFLYRYSRGIAPAPRPKPRKTSENLISREKTIKQRLAELDARLNHLDVVNSRAGIAGLDDVAGKLATAREIVDSQRRLYGLHLRKIELVRVQNAVAPYLERISGLSEFETENAIVVIDDATRKLDRMSAESESPEFVVKIAETNASITKIRESLVRVQASRALSGVSEIAESDVDLTLDRSANIFNIQTSLTDFSESFDELEREYQRLLAGQELEQKLLNQ